MRRLLRGSDLGAARLRAAYRRESNALPRDHWSRQHVSRSVLAWRPGTWTDARMLSGQRRAPHRNPEDVDVLLAPPADGRSQVFLRASQ